MATRVLIAISQRLYREALRDALTQRLGVEVVAEAADGRETLIQVKEASPDLVILQPGLKELNGAETIRQIHIDKPDLPVIAVSSHSDYPLVMRVLKAGARAFILTDGGLEELQRAVQASMEGRIYLSPGLEATIARSLGEPSSTASEILTHREIEVLQLLSEGKSTKRVAETLSVSTKTVETHRLHIMAKLRLYSIAELTKYAIRQGITTIAN
ncbi:MAG TPA: response regulator transcription factor [Candidatus Krumholzibacteria bacterium]|jgi:DNA-binding NarL/FixJ family response regulator|nr:response regulator transcription factor [Candidatus Krumholzibacteria bacterium]